MCLFYYTEGIVMLINIIIGLTACVCIGSFFGIALFLISYKLDNNNL